MGRLNHRLMTWRAPLGAFIGRTWMGTCLVCGAWTQ